MPIIAYLDGDFLDIHSGSIDDMFPFYCDETHPRKAHPERIIDDLNGHRVIEPGECWADRPTRIQNGPTLETYILEWLSLAEGSRIVWKTENHSHAPTSWSCHILDLGPTCGLSIDLRELPDYAYAVIPNDVESCFRLPADLTWSYFEDWVRNTHGIPLVSLRDGYQSPVA